MVVTIPVRVLIIKMLQIMFMVVVCFDCSGECGGDLVIDECSGVCGVNTVKECGGCDFVYLWDECYNIETTIVLD